MEVRFPMVSSLLNRAVAALPIKFLLTFHILFNTFPYNLLYYSRSQLISEMTRHVDHEVVFYFPTVDLIR